MRLPSFQFYPGDWLHDSVSGCSLAAQGLWLRMMLLMHDSPRYGYLCNPNGSIMQPGTAAQRCGCSPDQYEALLLELDSVGVPSRQSGIIFSRRMVRDAKKRADFRRWKKQERLRASQVDVRDMSGSIPSLSPSSPSQKEKVKIQDAAAPLDLPVSTELWAQFVTHRHKKRQPMTDFAASLVIRKIRRLEKKGYDAVELLETAIERGWLTVFEPKPDVPAKAERRNHCSEAQVGQGPELVGIKPKPEVLERDRKRQEVERLASIEEYRKKHPNWNPEAIS